MPRPFRDPEERFWEKVQKSETCWIWTAHIWPAGHGQFNRPGRYGGHVAAHRFSYEIHYGPIPDGLVIDHICHNPSCVNPQHLRACTQKQNMENLRGAHRDSASGIRGVHLCKKTGRWAAEVFHNGKKYWLGRHESPESAEAAVIAKRLELFTHNDLDRINRIEKKAA